MFVRRNNSADKLAGAGIAWYDGRIITAVFQCTGCLVQAKVRLSIFFGRSVTYETVLRKDWAHVTRKVDRFTDIAGNRLVMPNSRRNHADDDRKNRYPSMETGKG